MQHLLLTPNLAQMSESQMWHPPPAPRLGKNPWLAVTSFCDLTGSLRKLIPLSLGLSEVSWYNVYFFTQPHQGLNHGLWWAINRPWAQQNSDGVCCELQPLLSERHRIWWLNPCSWAINSTNSTLGKLAHTLTPVLGEGSRMCCQTALPALPGIFLSPSSASSLFMMSFPCRR